MTEVCDTPARMRIIIDIQPGQTARSGRYARAAWQHERFALGRVFAFVYAFDGSRLVLAHAGR